jgi:hypothetical protein
MNAPEIRPQRTPNPNAMKFTLDRPVIEGTQSRSINSAADARGDRIAEPLFGIPGVVGVFMVADFVTVMKSAEASWDDLVPRVSAALLESFR